MEVDIKTHTYDGDTPPTARQAIRNAGHIVVTNPDMLHSAILPHHTKWVKLFENLKYIVIDELHTYRGVFGSHVANVIRRLKRICRFYGSTPQFICASATIDNPKEHAERLIGEKVALVDNNGAPAGEKHFIFYNPPVVNRAARHPPEQCPGDAEAGGAAARSRHPDDRVCAQPRAGGNFADLSAGAGQSTSSAPNRSAATAAAICRSCGGRSSEGCAAAKSAASSARTRWSSASTSASCKRAS